MLAQFKQTVFKKKMEINYFMRPNLQINCLIVYFNVLIKDLGLCFRLLASFLRSLYSSKLKIFIKFFEKKILLGCKPLKWSIFSKSFDKKIIREQTPKVID